MRARPPVSELVAWSLLGIALGVVGGVALAGWLGPPTERPEEDSTAPVKRAEPARRLKASAAERAIEVALERDPELTSFELRALAVGPGVVELHGWVSSRPLRTRAMRLAAGVPGIDSVVNCLLVHGEDDPAEPVLDATDQSA
jgi:hypothetical protein